MNTLIQTDFKFSGQTKVYKGKVRDVYSLANNLLVMIATDRLSAFDVILPKGIPYKGQILNQIATRSLQQTGDIVPNWLVTTPDPNVSIGHLCTPLKVEMVIRGYLAGHATREYKAGQRTLCGVTMPEGMNENDAFDTPIITPTTKADIGTHDEDISREQILEQGIISENDYIQLEHYTKALFKRGTSDAAEKGLILVDTKYEFGKTINGKIVLIDEIHTPDSSRYFYKDTYQECQSKGLKQKQLSKEFVRQWLISNGFKGKQGQQVPEMTDNYITSVSRRYIELYEKITGTNFEKATNNDITQRIETNVEGYLKTCINY